MKKFVGSLVAAGCLVALSGAAHAYQTATLAQAIAGTVVIQTGDKLFTNFFYSPTGEFGPAGSDPIPASAVNVLYGTTGAGGPIVDAAGDYGILFTMPATLASGTGDFALGYTVTVTTPGLTITDVELDANAAAAGTGVVTVTEAFPGSGNPGLFAFATGTTSQLSASGDIIPGVTSLQATKDVAVSAGPAGVATISIIGQYFSESGTVPEPGAVAMLVGIGSGSLLILRRRRK